MGVYFGQTITKLPVTVDLNSNGLISLSWNNFLPNTPTQYIVKVDGVTQITTSSTTINNLSITTGSNRVLTIEYYVGATLQTTITKNLRLFTFTGVEESWTVPAGVPSYIIADVQGAQGGGNFGTGGLGGRMKSPIFTTAGTTLYIRCGGQGQGYLSYGCTSTVYTVLLGGFNGGGTGGGMLSDSYGCPGGQAQYRLGASGGGASDIRTISGNTSSRIIVAGGGGGSYGGAGGAGGGLTGVEGGQSDLRGGVDANGKGATQTSGGSGGASGGAAGTFGTGGTGFSSGYFGSNPGAAGGGGGGWYGGGGGGQYGSYSSAGAGGGGSGYIDPNLVTLAQTLGAITQGYRSGNGQILLSW